MPVNKNVDVKRKKYDYKTVIMCGKRCQNIFYWVKKKTCLGVLDIEEIRDKDNETGLKEGGRTEMPIYSASIRDARSFRLEYLPF
jgi:hypothetical protein